VAPRALCPECAAITLILGMLTHNCMNVIGASSVRTVGVGLEPAVSGHQWTSSADATTQMIFNICQQTFGRQVMAADGLAFAFMTKTGVGVSVLGGHGFVIRKARISASGQPGSFLTAHLLQRLLAVAQGAAAYTDRLLNSATPISPPFSPRARRVQQISIVNDRISTSVCLM